MKNKLGLFPISIEYLANDMRAEGHIYCYIDRRPVLMVTEGTDLTLDIIEKMKQADKTFRNIYISRSFYERLHARGRPPSLGQKHLETRIGYVDNKQQTMRLFEETVKSGTVSADQTKRQSQSLQEKLDSVAAALILQCINGENSVDEYLYTHSTNVALLNGLMGKWLKLPEEKCQMLISCGLLHDLGKTCVPPEILHAPRPLSEAEFDVVKRHPVYSYDILSRSPNILPEIALGALYHHEKMSGSGYPKGLHADDIPFFARVTAVSDVYDAMVSRRCYKEANSPFEILEQISEGRFSDLDFALTKVFLENMPRELVGRSILLSDGSIGKVCYVDPQHWTRPIIDVDGEVFTCDEERSCVSVAFDD